MEKESSQGYFLYLVLFLGLLNGFGPFVIDMYLPALPEMTHVFKTSASVIQLGLTFCMGGLAAVSYTHLFDSLPLNQSGPPRQKNDAAKKDSVPAECGEVMLRNVMKQPADHDECGEE